MMKNRLGAAALAVTLGAVAPGSVLARDDHHGHHGAAADARPAATPLAEGTVRKVDKAAARLTIAHGALESLAMPPMTMAFAVRDAGMLDRVAAGDRIRFRAEMIGGVPTVSVLEAAR